jgi:hypothetical protein
MATKLPLDLSTFFTLRTLNYMYVDKTQHAYNLITGGRRYFLSRPRRFGKSLFISTLKEILTGNKKLFNGLWIGSSDYTFEPHGVIALDLSSIRVNNIHDLNSGLCSLLQDISDDYDLAVTLNSKKPDVALRALVRALYAKFGRVAVLVDEYDNPMLQAITNYKIAREIRDDIRRFFAVIKSLDAFIDFVFITGVSSFAKAGLFSGINNLRVITMNNEFSTLCGYTDEEIEKYLSDHIKTWADGDDVPYDDMRKNIKEWYNGYHFSANSCSVYNPYSLMNAIAEREFKNFWFQSGGPTFLFEELSKESRKKESQIFELDKFETTEDSLGTFEIGATPLPALMFQTGYLTITAYDKKRRAYELGYPNFEVKTALQKYLLAIYTNLEPIETESIALKLSSALINKDIEKLTQLIKQLFVRVPYQLHGTDEKSYHAILQAIFMACGIDVQSETSISHGRLDMVIELPDILYVIEVKRNSSAATALKQIEQRKYFDALLHKSKTIILLGISFTRKPKVFDIEIKTKVIE